ncbi:tetratricopeptide repeat protein [Phormidium sp. CCY1219]|uniref:tetratricopeptide repeat protein n=1 Tax=Phormidium sp. CCY1219 TaxID=2886104 RepID=UPI002D1E6E60|nr:tetratricopeptide repeat protein [Phormidium sp. CCY1219]MEB3831761.1 tetratricopeptide repeat protein [Phormidium sp. CCY1219]
MHSNKLSKQHNREINSSAATRRDRERFFALNQQSFAELLTFVDFAENFPLGFIEINFCKDLDVLIAALQEHPNCQEIQWAIVDFGDREVRFLLDSLQKTLSSIQIQENKKFVLVLRGLEKSIGMFGEYPPILQDLNFMRDAFPHRIPHPILFCLPEFAITRLAKFAPDFWAWKSGFFHFNTAPDTRNLGGYKSLESLIFLDPVEVPEKQDRIDLLERLLMKYCPTGKQASQNQLKAYLTILNQLGKAYRSRGEHYKSRESLEESINIANCHKDLAAFKANALYDLGILKNNLGEIEVAIALHTESLELFERIGDLQGKAMSLGMLGQLLAKQGDFTTGLNYMQDSLAILERLGSPEAETVRERMAGVKQLFESHRD